MKTLEEISKIVGGRIIGNKATLIQGVAGLEEARSGDITFLANPKYKSLLTKTQASCVIIDNETECLTHTNSLICENPSLIFDAVINLFSPEKPVYALGVHATAIVHSSVKLGKDVAIGPHVVIEDKAVIGDRSVIWANSYVGKGTVIGQDALVYPNVTIREYVQIGDRVIIHSGTVIGSDGYGFIKINNQHRKLSQNGGVIIGDDVEIGANVTVDRARFQNTVIGRGTKIDNLVQIAHNVIIGENSLIVAQVGISGSTRIGSNVILAGQVGIVGHVDVGDNAVIGAQSGISKDVKPGAYMFGTPAEEFKEESKKIAHIRRLGNLYDKVKDLDKKIIQLEKAKT